MSERTPFFLLDGRTGWRAASLTGAALTDGGGTLGLQALPGSSRPLVDAAGSLGGLQTAIGVALDSQERVYVLDPQGPSLKRFDPCRGEFVTLDCVGGAGSEPRRLSGPRGLAISCGDDIHVTDTGNRRVQVFSVRGLALRQVWGPWRVVRGADGSVRMEPLPVGVRPPETWQPWDVATAAGGRVYVSDYANGLVHVFDHGVWRAAYTGAGSSSPGLVKPTRLALDREGRLYILQEGQNTVVVLDPEGRFLGTVGQPEGLAGRFCPVAVAVDVDGNLCLSDAVTRRMYFYRPDGSGGWCAPRPCGCVEAFASSLVFDRAGHAIYADGAQRLCQLAPRAEYALTGTYLSAGLDSRTYRCVWHRIVLGGAVPSGTAVWVDTFTAEADKSDDEIRSLPESRWATGQTDAGAAGRGDWDCLVQSPPGRYLWLRLTLSGDGATTPALDAVRVYYPRASSLQYLPAVYRADDAGGDFLDRFLSLFDTLRGEVTAQVATVARLFDPLATPAGADGKDFLAWLASWLGMTLQGRWPVAKRRELVRQAHRLYALRGTPEGLRLHVELYTGVRPRILELFRLRRWLFVNGARLGDDAVLFGENVMRRLHVGENSRVGSFQLIDYGDPELDLFNAYAHQFLVVVPRWPGAGEADEQAIAQIIDLARPAHTVGRLRWAEPRLRVGVQAFVGVDTVIGRYPVGVREGRGQLGYDTVLGDPTNPPARPAPALGETTRLGGGPALH